MSEVGHVRRSSRPSVSIAFRETSESCPARTSTLQTLKFPIYPVSPSDRIWKASFSMTASRIFQRSKTDRTHQSGRIHDARNRPFSAARLPLLNSSATQCGACRRPFAACRPSQSRVAGSLELQGAGLVGGRQRPETFLRSCCRTQCEPCAARHLESIVFVEPRSRRR